MVHYDKLFRGDNNPRRSVIEVEDISFKSTNQQMYSVGTFQHLKKYNSDILGNEYPILTETFKNKLESITLDNESALQKIK